MFLVQATSPNKEKKNMTRTECRPKNTHVPANSCLLIIHCSKHHLANTFVATVACKVKSLLANLRTC